MSAALEILHYRTLGKEVRVKFGPALNKGLKQEFGTGS
jgi:hypothetical protein